MYIYLHSFLFHVMLPVNPSGLLKEIDNFDFFTDDNFRQNDKSINLSLLSSWNYSFTPLKICHFRRIATNNFNLSFLVRNFSQCECKLEFFCDLKKKSKVPQSWTRIFSLCCLWGKRLSAHLNPLGIIVPWCTSGFIHFSIGQLL